MRILKAPRDDSTKVSLSLLGAVHILRNTGWGGRGVPDLLQYYSFERKIEGYNPFSALNKVNKSLLQYYSFEMKKERFNRFSALN